MEEKVPSSKNNIYVKVPNFLYDMSVGLYWLICTTNKTDWLPEGYNFSRMTSFSNI